MSTRIILCISLFLSLQLQAETKNYEWEKVKDENGIQVFIINTDHTDIVKAKTITEVNAPISKVRKILDDIDNRHTWIPFLKLSKAITEYSDNKRIEYSLFSAPWPASDRDFVYSLELVSNTKNQLVYKMHSVVTDLKPEQEYKIRADLFESVYTLTVIDKNTTRVELIFHADPKGWLPNWIINIIQKILPYKILRNLKIELNN